MDVVNPFIIENRHRMVMFLDELSVCMIIRISTAMTNFFHSLDFTCQQLIEFCNLIYAYYFEI